jgi:hypothetical protein
MSIVNLSTAVPYQPWNKPDSIELENVYTTVDGPEGALILLYGFREALEDISILMNDAKKLGNAACEVRVAIDIGETSRTSPEDIKNTRMLNLFTISASMQREIEVAWKKIMKNEGFDIDHIPDDYFRNLNYVKRHPKLLSKLREEDLFNHLEVICYPNEVEGSKITGKRAAVFSFDHVVSVQNMSNPEIKIELPELSRKHGHRP